MRDGEGFAAAEADPIEFVGADTMGRSALNDIERGRLTYRGVTQRARLWRRAQHCSCWAAGGGVDSTGARQVLGKEEEVQGAKTRG